MPGNFKTPVMVCFSLMVVLPFPQKLPFNCKGFIHCKESQENASTLTHKIHWKQHCTKTTADFWAGWSTDFLGNHLGKYHFATKKEKEASTECNITSLHGETKYQCCPADQGLQPLSRHLQAIEGGSFFKTLLKASTLSRTHTVKCNVSTPTVSQRNQNTC